MVNLKLWVRAVRAPFFTAAVIPVLLGYAVAWHDTSLFWWPGFFLTLVGIVSIHAATNLVNDYFDALAGCDEANPTPTPFSGGSRVIQEGLIPAKKMLWASLGFFAFGSAIGLYLNAVCGGNVILIIGIVGVFLAFFYSARPLMLGYGSLGEIATGIGFGPLIVMGAYFVNARSLSPRIFLISLPVGILIALVLFINEFPDWCGDKKVNKRTWVVILGKQKAAKLYRIALMSVYVVIVALVMAKLISIFCLLTLLTLPLANKASRVTKDHYEKISELLPANAATIGLHSLIGLLLCAGVIIDKILLLRR